jgi:D-beta-D-heptose 7-phosphate kinase/D-beta-D-heptose 1-phosphate adenosyltransferase
MDLITKRFLSYLQSGLKAAPNFRQKKLKITLNSCGSFDLKENMLKNIGRFFKLKKVVVATGGGFDPLHEGHIRLFKEAKKLGDVLIVMLNSDEQLIKKKGKTFYLDQQERKEIIESIKYVDKVIIDPGKDVTCEEALKLIKPDILAKGGDRTPGNMAEIEIKVCKELGCKIVYDVGGTKVQSSSWLLKRLTENDVNKKQ